MRYSRAPWRCSPEARMAALTNLILQPIVGSAAATGRSIMGYSWSVMPYRCGPIIFGADECLSSRPTLIEHPACNVHTSDLSRYHRQTKLSDFYKDRTVS